MTTTTTTKQCMHACLLLLFGQNTILEEHTIGCQHPTNRKTPIGRRRQEVNKRIFFESYQEKEVDTQTNGYLLAGLVSLKK